MLGNATLYTYTGSEYDLTSWNGTGLFRSSTASFGDLEETPFVHTITATGLSSGMVSSTFLQWASCKITLQVKNCIYDVLLYI